MSNQLVGTVNIVRGASAPTTVELYSETTPLSQVFQEAGIGVSADATIRNNSGKRVYLNDIASHGETYHVSKKVEGGAI